MIRSAKIDVITDYPEQMPDEVRRAEAHLASLAEDPRSRVSGPRMGLAVATADPAWNAVESYAAWSINADLTGEDGEELVTFHDCGYSVVASLTDDEVAVLRQRLAEVGPVTLLSGIHARRRLEKGGSTTRKADSTTSPYACMVRPPGRPAVAAP